MSGGSLAQLLTQTAARHGDRTALKLEDAELSYAAFDERRGRVAGLLKRPRRAARATASG